MESNWSKLFVNKNGTKTLSPLASAFIVIQIIIFIVIIATIIWVSSDKLPNDDATRYARMPELTIKDLAKKAPILSEKDVANIQKKLFKIVSENTSSIDVDKIEATIRNDETHAQDFNGKSKYINMIVDISSLKQSYEVFFSSNAIIDPDVSTFVLCLDEHSEVVYKDFKCKTTDNAAIREKIVTSYLKYFKFEYFSAYISADDPETIIISPSITYDNDEETKAKYIDEVKSSIESLGLPSDTHKYYVRTAKDVNYENKD